jgi:hypothetical protein
LSISRKNRKPPGIGKSLWTRGNVAKFRLLLVALVLAALAVTALFLTRPRAVWLVDGAYRELWERILDTAQAPRRIRLVTAPEEGGPLKRNWHGFIISARGPLEREAPDPAEGEGDGLPSLVLYPALSVSREYKGALLLALDPWMMFRDYKDPAVSRERVDAGGGGEGLLIMPGRDQASRWAWAAQLLQRRSGVFPEDKAEWQAALDGLFRDRRFQPGAETYGWPDALPLLYRSSPAWIYAPLSRIRQQPPVEAGGLEANRYPEAEDWHEFGIQATMLWAIPFGRERDLEKLADTKLWLAEAQTQTAIANALGWIPAHPAGAPYNAISRSARLACLSCSFIWTFDPFRGL